MRHGIRKILAGIALVGLTLTSACSPGGGQADEPLDVYLNMTAGSAQYTEMKNIVAKYEQRTGTRVKLAIDSSNFEDNMKVRMAADEMPDVFSTHGWSVLRYKPFLEPLTHQAWAKNLDPLIDETMRDANGDVYSLPIEYSVAGMSVNFDVLRKAGVDPDGIRTWDDFAAACAKIKATGVTPIDSAGKDFGPSGDLANVIAANAFTEREFNAMKHGTFDSSAYATNVLGPVASWAQAEYFNKDYVSASIDDQARKLALGQAAFVMAANTSTLSTALAFNEKADVGFIPFPSTRNGQYLVGGEGVNAFAAWKGSPRKKRALQFLAFLAEPANAKAMSRSIGSSSGLTNVDVDLGRIQSSYDKWVAPRKMPIKPYLDRAYLPNGMFASLITTTDSVINRQSTPESAASEVGRQYKTLFGQQK